MEAAAADGTKSKSSKAAAATSAAAGLGKRRTKKLEKVEQRYIDTLLVRPQDGRRRVLQGVTSSLPFAR